MLDQHWHQHWSNMSSNIAQCNHWNPRVAIMPTLSTLAALQVMTLTTFGATSEDNVSIRTKIFSEWHYPRWLNGLLVSLMLVDAPYVGPTLVIIGPTWTPCNLCTGSMASVTATWRGMPQGAYVSCRATIAMTTLFGWSSIIACCDVAEEMPATCWWWHGAATMGWMSAHWGWHKMAVILQTTFSN